MVSLKYMSEKEFDSQLKRIRAKNVTKKRMAILKAEEEKYKAKPKFKLPSTSKLVLFGAILLCLEIVIFCEYVMIELGDTSAMYVLVGIPATLIPVIWGYYSKSKAENTKNGIIYDLAMKTAENKTQEDDEDLSGNNIVG